MSGGLTMCVYVCVCVCVCARAHKKKHATPMGAITILRHAN